MEGGGKCSYCNSLGTTMATCPLNPNAKNINIEKHYLAKNIKKSVKEPIKKPVKKPVKDPLKKSVKKPVKEPIKKSVKKSMKDPLKKSVKEPIKKSVKKSMKEKKTIKKKLKDEEIKPYIKKSIKSNKSIKFIQKNPKKTNSKAYMRYEKYKKSTKLGEVGNLNDIINDYKKGYLEILDDSSIQSIESIKEKSKPLIKREEEILKFIEYLDKIHSISGICNYGRIDLTSGPILLNMGDLHTWSDRDVIEKDSNRWGQLCESNKNMEKNTINFFKLPTAGEVFIETQGLIDSRVLTDNILSSLKNNEIFISYFVIYILKNFKNVHLFLEFHSTKGGYYNTGRHATPMFFNESMIEMSRNKPDFMKDNNNFIHYNDFRTSGRSHGYFYYNLFELLKDDKFKFNGDNKLQKLWTATNGHKIPINFTRNGYLNFIEKLYIQVFLQGFKFKDANQDWKRKINLYMIYDNKDLVKILKNMGIYKNDLTKLIWETNNISLSEKEHSIKINGEKIYCTRISKQLLKLKPEIQEKVVKWFYDLIISKLDHIVNFNHNTLNIEYIFNIMFIDFYNLCRILYYTGYGNTNIDMSNNIILNYGGENMYLNKPNKYQYFNILDNNTGGHASSVLLFYRKYLYGNGTENNYIEKPTNKKLKQKRHFNFKNENIEIKKYLSRYIENRQEGRDCIEIK